tara:strand:- start:792 stop:974 length:183 start_codon:yes stop_codon:yes gene_type:complete
MKTITVTIENGEASVKTSGFKGKECLTATAELEKALGKQTTLTMTPESRLQASTAERVRS